MRLAVPTRRRPWTRGRMVGVAVGAALIVAAVTGRAGLYVRGYFVPVVAATGLALVVIGWRRPPQISRRALMVLCLPVVVGIGLGPQQAARVSQGLVSGGLGARLGDGANPLLQGGGGPVTLLQIDLAAEQLGPVALIGRDVEVQAEVAGPSSLERPVMVCCAADARPVSLAVSGGRLPVVGTWVDARGQLSAGNGQAVLVVSSVRTIPVPAQPIL